MITTRGRRAIGIHCAGLAFALAALVPSGCRPGATRASILYADALERLAVQDSTGAFTLLQDAAYSDPKDARVRFLLGQLYEARGTIEARAHAETELRAAVDLAPDNALYAARLGDVLHQQGFNSEARARLRQAVRLDPTLAEAWHTLGLQLLEDYREEPGNDAFRDSTLFCFESAIDSDPSIADARWRLAVLLLERGQVERAREVARGGFAAADCPGRWGVLLAAIEYRAQRPVAASAALDSTRRCLSEADRDSFLVPGRLMPPDSTFCVDCSSTELDSTLTAYWWAFDPTPATLVNERMIEHVARTIDADFWFEVPRMKVAGRDTDRGEIYLRYGQPELMWKDITENRRTWFWSYRSPPQTTFVFQDLYQNHLYVRARPTIADFTHPALLRDAPHNGRTDFGPPAPGWRTVLRQFRIDAERVAIEIAYGFVAYRTPDSLRVEVAAWLGPGKRIARRSLLVPRSHLYRVDPEHVVGRVRLEVPSEPLEIGLQVAALGSVIDSAAPAGTVAGAPVGDALREPPHVAAERLAAARRAAERPGGSSAANDSSDSRLVTRLLWTGMARDSVDAASYIEGSIEVSDLMLAHVLGPTGRDGPFDLGGRLVVPRVDAEIRGGRIDLYFEIYTSAQAAKARRSFYVTYRVAAEPPTRWRFRDQFSSAARARRSRRTAVESTFMIEPRDAIEKQDLKIDVASLSPGDYSLTVEVQERGQAEKASRTIRFSIPESGSSDNR